MRKLTIVALALCLLPAVSQAKTLEDLLVEKGVLSEKDLRADNHMSAAKVYWNKGSRLEFPDNGFTTKIATQLQPRYTFTDGDNDTAENNSSFTLRRARLDISGTALNEEFSYKMQAGFTDVRNEDGSRSPELLDAYIEWAPCEGGGIRMGQFKSGISRQFNNSSTALQFPDRSLASEAFDLDRQAGLAVHTALMDGRLKVGGQFLNGESTGEGLNSPGADTNHTYVATARMGLMGEMDAYTEGDLEWTEDMAMDIGAAYAFSDNTEEGIDNESNRVSVDTNIKTAGMSFHGEFFWADEDASESEPVGFYAQAGYFITPKKLEIAARYSFLDCDESGIGSCSDDAVAGGVDDVNGVDVSLNYYFWKNFLKAQLSYGFVNKDPLDAAADEVNTNRWIFQVSSYF